MKVRKLLAGLVLAILAIGAVFAFAGCKNEGEDDKKPVGGGEVTISYQFSGVMDGEDLDSFSFAKGAFWLKLMSDGSAVMDRYNFGNYNASPAEENDDYVPGYMSGEWETVNRDGVEALSIEVYMLTNGVKTNTATGTAYNRNGTYSCSLRLEVVQGSGFYRAVEFTGGTTLYADADEFITENAQTFTPPASLITFTAEGGTVYVQEAGKALIYSGYSQIAEVTYANDGEGNMTITAAGKTIDVAVDTEKNTATFEYEYSMYGEYTTKFTFVCADYSKIPVVAAQAPAENVFTGTYSGMTWTLTLTDDENCTISAKMGGFDVVFNCTYVKDADNVVTLTPAADMDAAYKPAWAVIDGVKWQLGEDNAMTAIAPQTPSQQG